MPREMFGYRENIFRERAPDIHFGFMPYVIPVFSERPHTDNRILSVVIDICNGSEIDVYSQFLTMPGNCGSKPEYQGIVADGSGYSHQRKFHPGS